MPTTFVNDVERDCVRGIEEAEGVRVWSNRLGCDLPRRRCSIQATPRGLSVVLEARKGEDEPFQAFVTSTTNPWAAYELVRQSRARGLAEGVNVEVYDEAFSRWTCGWTIQEISGSTVKVDRRREYQGSDSVSKALASTYVEVPRDRVRVDVGGL